MAGEFGDDKVAHGVVADRGDEVGDHRELGEGEGSVYSAAAGGEGQVVEEAEAAGGRERVDRPGNGVNDGDACDQDVGQSWAPRAVREGSLQDREEEGRGLFHGNRRRGIPCGMAGDCGEGIGALACRGRRSRGVPIVGRARTA